MDGVVFSVEFSSVVSIVVFNCRVLNDRAQQLLNTENARQPHLIILRKTAVANQVQLQHQLKVKAIHIIQLLKITRETEKKRSATP